MVDVEDPVPTYPGDPRLRLRLYVERRLVAQYWIDATAPNLDEQVAYVRERQFRLAAAAQAAGKLWLVEAYDPADDSPAGVRRFGTDVAWYPDTFSVEEAVMQADALMHAIRAAADHLPPPG